MATRTTHEAGSDVALFLIGMRFNKLHRIDAWLPAFFAMPRMLRELSKLPDSGLLSYRLLLGERGITVVQYWRDVQSIYDYANAENHEHRPAWVHFYRTAKRVPGAVGVWHETYELARAESLYVDMPPTGIAAALGVVTVGRAHATAEARLHRGSEAPSSASAPEQ